MTSYPKSFYSSVTKRAIQSSEIVAEILLSAIKPRSIIDIGSGEGIWLNTISNKFPSASDLTAVDLQSHKSEYFDSLTENYLSFKFIEHNFEIDCELPDEHYDLAICLEVLEHLQPQTAELLAAEISKKCSILVFSGAVKGQGGTGHVNENSIDYWIGLLTKHNFVALDILRPQLKKNSLVADFYKENMLLFWHPENCRKTNTFFDLESLLVKNPLGITDTRKFTKKCQHFLVSLLPHWMVTRIVLILDKTVRR
jgi:2-polyprenyl-3-methyl-5-hydroxy-6-metoxy-1,4-benzoquinol methylase